MASQQPMPRGEACVSGPWLVFATSGPLAEVGLAWSPGPGGAGGVRTDLPSPPPHLEVERLGAGSARGRDLLPAVERLLQRAGLVPGDLRAVIVDVGPGGFTGVRLGVTAAKSLAFALGLPAVPITSLLALAQGAPSQAEVIAVRDGGRGTVYAAQLGPVDAEGRRPTRVAAQRLVATELAAWERSALLVGEDATALAREHALPQRPLDLSAGAAPVLALGRAALARDEVRDAATLVPLYLQASAPERLRAGESAPAASGRPASRPKTVEG